MEMKQMRKKTKPKTGPAMRPWDLSSPGKTMEDIAYNRMLWELKRQISLNIRTETNLKLLDLLRTSHAEYRKEKRPADLKRIAEYYKNEKAELRKKKQEAAAEVRKQKQEAAAVRKQKKEEAALRKQKKELAEIRKGERPAELEIIAEYYKKVKAEVQKKKQEAAAEVQKKKQEDA